MSMEQAPMREESVPGSEKFDGKGNIRTQRVMEDGTVTFLSEEEYTEELEHQREH